MRHPPVVSCGGFDRIKVNRSAITIRLAELSQIQRKEKVPEMEEEKQKKMPGNGVGFLKAAANAVLILLNGFMIALIVCLFLAQPAGGDRVKPTIQKFNENSDQYYSEDETYQQVNANVHVYQSTGRPDEKE